MKTEKDSNKLPGSNTVRTSSNSIDDKDSPPVSNLEPPPFYPFSAEDFQVVETADDREEEKRNKEQTTSPVLAMHNYAKSPENGDCVQKSCPNIHRSPDKVANQGFKTMYEEGPPPSSKLSKAKKVNGNDKGSGQRKSNYVGGRKEEELEDEIIQNCVAALDDSKWSQRYCPHCLSIEEIETLLKSEADKFSELQDDDGYHNQILEGKDVNDENSFGNLSSEYDRLWLQNNKNFPGNRDHFRKN